MILNCPPQATFCPEMSRTVSSQVGDAGGFPYRKHQILMHRKHWLISTYDTVISSCLITGAKLDQDISSSSLEISSS
jgi:hypothetical protein